MNPYVKALVEKYNAEEVAGNIIATINGKREVIAKVTNFGFQYTPIGERECGVRDEADLVQEVEAKKRGRPPQPKLGIADYKPGMKIGE
jgi:hypothetical protein